MFVPYTGLNRQVGVGVQLVWLWACVRPLVGDFGWYGFVLALAKNYALVASLMESPIAEGVRRSIIVGVAVGIYVDGQLKVEGHTDQQFWSVVSVSVSMVVSVLKVS